MIQTTFQTLKKHPEIIIGMAIVVVIMAIAYVPAMMGIDDLIDNFQRLENGETEAASDVVGFYAMTSLFGFLGGILIYFFIIPTLMNRVYEACAGLAEPGWVGRGIKRCWWKPFVTGLLVGAASMVISLVTAILNIIPILGALVSFAVMIAVGVFSIIAYTATIADESFGTGLSGTFQTGGKYFFKLLGIIVLTMIIPIIVMGIFTGSIMTNTMMNYYNATASPDPAEIMANMLRFMKPMLIIFGIMSVYSIFASPFIYTYSMHQYLSLNGLDAPPSAPKPEYVVQSRDMTL